MEEKEQNPVGKMSNLKPEVAEVFDELLHAELFASRCHDTGDSVSSVENAKLFKEDLL